MRHIIQHALLGLLIGAVLRAGLKSNSVHGQSILKNEATVTAIPHTEGSLRWHRDWMNEVFPILEEQCSHCHWSTVEAEAGLEFDKLSDAGMALENHRVLKSIVRAVVSGDMPPENPMDPGLRKKVQSWYEDSYRPSLRALPGPHSPRRLSRHELRYSIASVFGFEPEVAIIEAEQTVVEKSLVLKLLPLDPPGQSGFTNDTHTNPLTETHWEQLSLIVDSALETLLGSEREQLLSQLIGKEITNPVDSSDAILVLEAIYERAFRRPPPENFLERAIMRIQSKEDDELLKELKAEVKSILLSPLFLYRGLLTAQEQSADDALVGRVPSETLNDVDLNSAWPVDDYELASRLSFFLWCEPPDRALLNVAARGDLSQSKIYREQINRMLDDERSKRLAEHFAVEWLSLSEIEKVSNNPPVAHALLSQPIDYFDYLIKENRPITELLASNYTFANAHTAKFYPKDRRHLATYRKQRGIEVEALANQRLELASTTERGGILTMPGVLAMNRGPVVRGTWMLEKILGVHLPEPPANIGQVPSNEKGEDLTFRERFELHRSQPSCASCHQFIDPLGFALDRYTRDGSYLSDDDAKRMGIDTRGELPDGQSFSDFAELRELLLSVKSEQVARNLVERLLSYALCRELEWFDEVTVDTIVEKLIKIGENGSSFREEVTFHDLIILVADSLPFTHSR